MKPACCGIICSLCPRFIATKSGSEKEMKKVAALWKRAGFRDSLPAPGEMICRGCSPSSACAHGIVACAAGKNVENCGMCRSFPCERIKKTFKRSEGFALRCKKTLSAKDYRQLEKAFFHKRENLGRQAMKNIRITGASLSDAPELLKLQRLAFRSEAEFYKDFSIEPLTQTLRQLKADFDKYLFLKAVFHGRIAGSVKGALNNGTCWIGRLIVHPDFQNLGLGTALMGKIEKLFRGAKQYELGTGFKTKKNIYLYEKLGYRIYGRQKVSRNVWLVMMRKKNKFLRHSRHFVIAQATSFSQKERKESLAPFRHSGQLT